MFLLYGSRKTNILGRLPRKVGPWTVCKVNRRFVKNEGVMFWRGVDTPMHTMNKGCKIK